MAVLKMADEPKPRSEACLAEQERRRGRGLHWDRGALQLNMRPGMAERRFFMPEQETGLHVKHYYAKKFIPVSTRMNWILG